MLFFIFRRWTGFVWPMTHLLHNGQRQQKFKFSNPSTTWSYVYLWTVEISELVITCILSQLFFTSFYLARWSHSTKVYKYCTKNITSINANLKTIGLHIEFVQLDIDQLWQTDNIETKTEHRKKEEFFRHTEQRTIVKSQRQNKT